MSVKKFLSEYGSLLVALVCLSSAVLKCISIGSSFDESSAIFGLLYGGFIFFSIDFLVPFWLSMKSRNPEA